jgi:hypothetical protein
MLLSAQRLVNTKAEFPEANGAKTRFNGSRMDIQEQNPETALKPLPAGKASTRL